MTPPRHFKRLAWLLACVFAGVLIALIGSALTGSPAWYLAVPALVALGWLFLADPTECEAPRRDGRAKRAPRNEETIASASKHPMATVATIEARPVSADLANLANRRKR